MVRQGAPYGGESARKADFYPQAVRVVFGVVQAECRAVFVAQAFDDGKAEAGAFSHGQAPRREASEVLRFVEEHFPGAQPGEFGPIAACRVDGEVLGLLKIIDNRFATVLVF